MKLFIDEVSVIFPYEYIYPEQLEYMVELKRGLDAKGHVVLEMPSGTGKTISLLSLLVAYLNHHKDERIKLVYCTRTVVEMTKTVEELRRLVRVYAEEGMDLWPMVALCLTARKNMCIHPTVSQLTYTHEVDAACRLRTARGTDESCRFYDGLGLDGDGAPFKLPAGIYSLDDLRDLGQKVGVCPYFAAREALQHCDIVIQSYLYMVDPKVSPAVTRHLPPNTIVVFDEGHNVDDVCIEAMSMVVTKADAQQARDRGLPELEARVESVRTNNRQRLQNEYDRLLNGLALAEAANATGRSVAGAEQELLPGALRQASHFTAFLSRIVDYFFRLLARMTHPQTADPLTFLTKLRDQCHLDIKHVRFTEERLRVLLNTLEVVDSGPFRHLTLIADFVSTLAIHFKDDRHALPGYVVIFEPYDPTEPGIPDPVLRLMCVDASLAVRDVFGTYRSVVLTSGTLSPLDMYPKVLGFTPAVSRSLPMTLSRRCICPVIVTRSSDQHNLLGEELTSSYKTRIDDAAQSAVTKAYSSLLLNLATTVPDGIVCFFTGYRYMGEVLLSWSRSGFLDELAAHKLVFIETQGVEETSAALQNYRRACDIGRGAIFISIARGKIAEGIDFDRHYGRAVVMFGVPFLPPDDKALEERLKWMDACLGIPDSEFRNFDAMRQASQCIGRVLRNKTDYGMMLLVDRRFALNDKRRKLPVWIQQCLKDNTNLSTDAAVSIARGFFKDMAQPWEHTKDLGNTLFDANALAARGHGEAGAPPAAPTEEHDTPEEGILSKPVAAVKEDGSRRAKRPRD